MRLNRIIIIICLFNCLLIGLNSCNSSKSTKTANTDTTATAEKAIEQVEETVRETKTDLEKKEKVAETKVKETIKETKKVVQTEKDKIKTTTINTPAKQVDTAAGKTKAAASKKMQQQKADLVGKYKWLKRVCCGRMQKTTLPGAGEETFMTFTEDGKVLYSGTALKNAENCEYTLDMNFRSFPERPMLKMGKKVAALLHFYGDTLLIDRGYIDLDKNYWLKVE